jgi:cobalt-zinc-cadmium efflux system protein
MAHDHAHGHAAGRAGNRRRMWIALAINLAMLAAAVAGGIITGSLALLADAGHVISDVGAIALGLAAAGLATRPGAARRTFGYRRSEVIAALINGVALVVIAVLIVVAAIGRLSDPPEVDAGGVMLIGAVGLAGNALAAWVLMRGDRSDINLEGVLRHAAADALGSLAVVVSAAVILAGGSAAADPIASLVIAVLIAASSVRLIREPLDVLMEAAPEGVDPDELGRAICETDGVLAVHELHVWTVTSGFDALAAHVVVASGADRDRARREVEYLLRDRFEIEHTTLQMEEEGREGELLEVQTPLQRP